MKLNTTVKITAVAILVGILYYLSLTLFNRIALLAFLNGAFLGVLVLVIIIYLPLLAMAVRADKFDRVSQIALGVTLLWIGTGLSRTWWLVFNGMGKSVNLANHWFLGVIVLTVMTSGCLFVSAATAYSRNDTIKPLSVDRKSWIFTLGFGLVGGLIGLYLASLNYKQF